MPNKANPAPRLFPGVMLSGTFKDLEQHRAALIGAIKGQGLADVAMENDSAKPDVDVIDSSLRMVREASAYIGILSRKYGQIPQCPHRNPDNLSITELEFNEAQQLGRPILLFIMGGEHPLREEDFEFDAGKREKLSAFRERAKRMSPDSQVHRVYAVFDSLEEFNKKAIHAVAGLRRYLDEKDASSIQPQDVPSVTLSSAQQDPIPSPPALYAEPPYIGSHEFVGRTAQLDALNDWAAPADPHPILLFDAIGGSGKSMLTWEWTIRHATQVRGDWAGRFWYSFYERGAIMADFCRRALAYITGKPLDSFRKQKTPELSRQLLHHLQNRPWLLILDGLERVLVAYHRFDAAEVTDEQASQPTDQIAHRDPCAAIRPEDDDLLRAFAAVTPSKILISSRLVPRVLLNPASQPIPGVQRISLPGLRPPDAESLIRSCGVTGDSQALQNYLKSHCDCHPLVIGVLAGLVKDYLPDPGNFDAWATDPASGGGLNLAQLDLVQKRNHILHAGLNALPEKSLQLLSTLALLSEAADYPTLSALNPHLSHESEKVPGPDNPKILSASRELASTVRDLVRRGLLQYDTHTKRYDLHPVVRGIAAGRLRPEERDSYGQRIVDHFSERHHGPYEQAETLEDVRDGLYLVRTLLKMGRFQQACDTYIGDLSSALLFNLEAHAEILYLLRTFFPQGWAYLPSSLTEKQRSILANNAALALQDIGELEESSAAYGAAVANDLRQANWLGLHSRLSNLAWVLYERNRLAQTDRYLLFCLNLATLNGDKARLFRARLDMFSELVFLGRWNDANRMWDLLNAMGFDWPRNICRPGDAEYRYAQSHLWQGDLSEEQLTHAEQLAQAGRNRTSIRYLQSLRGEWHLQRGDCPLAAESFHQAVSMTRATGQTDAAAETLLALTKVHLGQLADPHREAEQLATAKQPYHSGLAELWLAIGDREQAKKHALTAYRWAWADGEPYVRRYELNKSRALLETLGAEIPQLPPYDPAKSERFPWEDELAAAIEKLRIEKERENREKGQDPL